MINRIQRLMLLAPLAMALGFWALGAAGDKQRPTSGSSIEAARLCIVDGAGNKLIRLEADSDGGGARVVVAGASGDGDIVMSRRPESGSAITLREGKTEIFIHVGTNGRSIISGVDGVVRSRFELKLLEDGVVEILVQSDEREYCRLSSSPILGGSLQVESAIGGGVFGRTPEEDAGLVVTNSTGGVKVTLGRSRTDEGSLVLKKKNGEHYQVP